MREKGGLADSAMDVVCRQLNHDSRPFMMMENFIIMEKYRRKGLGLLLIREMERPAVEMTTAAPFSSAPA